MRSSATGHSGFLARDPPDATGIPRERRFCGLPAMEQRAVPACAMRGRSACRTEEDRRIGRLRERERPRGGSRLWHRKTSGGRRSGCSQRSRGPVCQDLRRAVSHEQLHEYAMQNAALMAYLIRCGPRFSGAVGEPWAPSLGAAALDLHAAPADESRSERRRVSKCTKAGIRLSCWE
jgi:hypothetical protein